MNTPEHATRQPSKKGYYFIQVKTPDGQFHEFNAWFNPGSGHWMTEDGTNQEIGFGRAIMLKGWERQGELTEWTYLEEEQTK